MDIAVVVNVHARRGSERMAERVSHVLPGARVVATRSLADARGFADSLRHRPTDLVVSAGGDGSAVAILNAMRASHPLDGASEQSPALGLLPFGTGNAWARSMGAPGWRRAVTRLAAMARDGGEPPTKWQPLVSVDGIDAPFAGTGWDAEILSDFQGNKRGLGLVPPSLRKGLFGYFRSLFTRTIPRMLSRPAPEVEIWNTGAPAMRIDEHGRPVLIPGGEAGALLYRGPLSVCGASTTEQLGFGMRAFPFYDSVPGRFCLRIYAAGVVEATLRMPQLWKGTHPLPRDHQFMLTAARLKFSRPVPLEIGGDVVGTRTEVEYRVSERPIEMLDWNRLAA